MNDTIPLRTRRMTAKEVLEGLRDLASDALNGRDLDTVSFETCVADYYPLLDDLTTGLFDPSGTGRADNLGKSFNTLFRIQVTDWRSVLLPLDRQTLGDVCRFIADHDAEVVELDQVTVLGRPCLSAGTFRTLKALLAESQVGACEIGPSTPLESVRGWKNSSLCHAVVRTAPGLLSRLRFPMPGLVWLWMALMIVLCFSGGFLLPWVGKWLVCRFIQLWRLNPRTVTHPDLGPVVTFRDLTRAVLYHRNVTLSPSGTAP